MVVGGGNMNTQVVVNKDGVEVYLIQELPDGRVEVGFNTCNKTKICSKKQFKYGTVSDYISVPSQYDFISYHLGEQRRQENGNIAKVVGGTGQTLRVQDITSHKEVMCRYRDFYNGTCFGTNAPKTKEDFFMENEDAKNTFEMTVSFTYNGITVYKYGNRACGYVPCLRLDNERIKVWNIRTEKYEIFTLREMDARLRRLKYSVISCFYDCNFFVGEKLNILPFGISATILETEYSETGVDATVKFDGVELETVVDLYNPYLSIRGLVTGKKLLKTSKGTEYSKSKAGILFYFNCNKYPLLLRNLRIVNGYYFIDVSYKMKRAENKIRTKSVRLQDIDTFIHDEIRRML